ncbi:MAG TPA: hypothetical protein VKR21_03485 [Solirubrobacteraceae bacterium]|nr:hypothetical protein [Solirubrobacteraceae bacterium]
MQAFNNGLLTIVLNDGSTVSGAVNRVGPRRWLRSDDGNLARGELRRRERHERGH